MPHPTSTDPGPTPIQAALYEGKTYEDQWKRHPTVQIYNLASLPAGNCNLVAPNNDEDLKQLAGRIVSAMRDLGPSESTSYIDEDGVRQLDEITHTIAIAAVPNKNEEWYKLAVGFLEFWPDAFDWNPYQYTGIIYWVLLDSLKYMRDERKGSVDFWLCNVGGPRTCEIGFRVQKLSKNDDPDPDTGFNGYDPTVTR